MRYAANLLAATVLVTAAVSAADPEADVDQAEEATAPTRPLLPEPEPAQSTSIDPAADDKNDAVDNAVDDEDRDSERRQRGRDDRRETRERVEVGDIDAVFVPSEAISADSAVSFPADI